MNNHHHHHHGLFLLLLVLSSTILVCYGAKELKAVDPETKVDTVPKTKKTDDNNKTGEHNVKETTLEPKSVPKVGSEKEKEKEKTIVKPKDGDSKPVAKAGEVDKGKIGEPKITGKEEPLKQPKKESGRGEKCGSSNNCVDEKNKLVACLRVPGDDSPALSLLIQYEGTAPLTAEISAPDSVILDRKSVQFQVKGNQKVKVSLGKDSKNTTIVLTAKGSNSNCSIDFSDLIQRNPAEKSKATIPTTTKPSVLERIINENCLVIIISIGIILPILGAIPICIIRRRKQQLLTSPATYQKLETELPVSATAGKKETDVEEGGGGWDDSWGDSWDDEEAPQTPSLPITPSLSSKGLASRKLTKDSWKD